METGRYGNAGVTGSRLLCPRCGANSVGDLEHVLMMFINCIPMDVEREKLASISLCKWTSCSGI